MNVKRKLTTIFCADVVGYSRLMGVDEPGTLKRLKGCRELMAGFVERHHGRVVSWTGDAVLADFSSVVEAVQCAIEVQRELKARNEHVPVDQRMEFRVGLNLGDVMIEEHDIFGEGVNIAARLQSIAPKGGILISGSVYEQVRNKLTVGFNFMGHQQVKNIADQVPAYVVMHDGTAVPAGAAHQAKAALGAVEIPSHATAPIKAAGLSARMAAGAIDWGVAIFAVFFLSLVVELAAPRTVDLSLPFGLLASERVARQEEPSMDILNGGALILKRDPKIVERTTLGLVTQTFRVTRLETELRSGGETADATGAIAAPVKRTTAVSALTELIDPKSGAVIEAPSFLWLMPLGYLLLVAGFEAASRPSASPGKRLLNLSVAGVKGGESGGATALLRNGAKIASALPLMAGFLMPFWTTRRQALHDIVAGSVVTKR